MPDLTTPPPSCDCTIDGHRVELVPDTCLLVNDDALAPLPNEQNVLFPRLHPSGTRFAGIGHLDNHCWEWLGRWVDHGPCEGPHAVIYDADGLLRIVRETEGAPTGSQGWRYVADDGRLVPAFETYADTARGIYEYTERGDVTVGQGGDEEGLQAFIRGRRVLLEAGVARFIRFYRAGDRVAVAYVRNHTEARFLFSTVTAWDALPTYHPAQPPEPLPPYPEPEPEPEPTPMPDPESLAPLVQDVFARRLGHLTRPATNDECAAVLNEVAWIKRADGWGLSAKPGGNNAAQPKTGIRVAYDILQNRNYAPPDDLWDALGPSENPKPLWGKAHPHNDPNRPWVPPVIPDGVTNPDPPPTDPPPTDPLPDPLAVRVARLEGKVKEQTDAILALVEDLTDMGRRLKALEDAPIPPPQPIDLTRYRAKSNGGWLGHTHDLEAKP